MNNGVLTSRTAVVTGASSGHGRRIAEVLAASGANVVIADLNDDGGCETVATLEKQGSRAIYVRTDVSDDDAVAALMDAATSEFGAIDILMNNAGITQNLPVEDISLDKWRKMLDINLAGAFLCIKNALPSMRKSGGGSIVNISSAAAVMVRGHIGTAHYAASKAGMLGLTKAVAKEAAADGVRANAVAPGLCRTPMTASLLAENEKEAQLTRRIPMRRIGTSDDIANLVRLLASEDAAYITGQTIFVDGGGPTWGSGSTTGGSKNQFVQTNVSIPCNGTGYRWWIGSTVSTVI